MGPGCHAHRHREYELLRREADPEAAEERRRRHFVEDASRFGVIVGICVAIWLFTGLGYFWPAWVIAIGGFKLAARARDTFGGDERVYADADT